jgi:SAM-dependent methyltransferase
MRANVDDAVLELARVFPFPGYVDVERGTYYTVADVALRYLPPGSRVLDFGSGPCDKTALLASLGYQCSAYDDLSDPWHEVGDHRQRIFDFARSVGIDFRRASEKNSAPLPFDRESFDMVTLMDVLEHFHDSPREVLNDLVELLKPGGFLVVTVPNAVNARKRLAVVAGRTNMPRYAHFYWNPGPWRAHVREYTKGDLAEMTDYLGLTQVELRACDHMLEVVPRRVRPLYRAATKLAPGLKDSWLLVARKPDGWTPKRLPPPDELRELLGQVTHYKYQYE